MATPNYITSLIGTESGGNWKAQNSEIGAGGMAGHFGRVQFGRARLDDAMRAGAIPAGTTPEQFMASPELQMAAEAWHFADLERNLSDLVGKEVNGVKMDMGALVAMGHLGGAAGARKYVETGGAYNPSDAYGTSLSDYASKHGAAHLGGNPDNRDHGTMRPMGGNSLATQSVAPGQDGSNALAQRPQLRWDSMQQDPSAFMNRNTLARM